MVKAYAFGLFGAALVVFLVGALWLSVKPREEGLVWGDKVYETRDEFNGYLKSKGLSYDTWLARNPGLAPWEPEPDRRAKAPESAKAPPTASLRRTASAAARADSDGSALPSLFLPALALTLVTGFGFLLLRGRRPVLARLATDVGSFRVPRAHAGGWGSVLSATAIASTERLGDATLRGAARVRDIAPAYGRQVGHASVGAGRLVLRLARINGIGLYQVVMGLLVTVGAIVWGALVVLMLSAL